MTDLEVVAIIDDDSSVRAGLESLVNSLGIAILAFESARDYLASPRIGDVSCIIADVQMPGMSGLELQTELARVGRNTPIILITAYYTETARERAINAGALAFLEKPFDGNVIADLLRNGLTPSGPNEA